MDIRAVVAIDFGTTFSGFAYANRVDPEITNDVWPQQIGVLKTNTVLQYDSNYQNVIKWGNPALAQRQSRKNKDLSTSKSVELFKLHLGNIPQNEKPPLPHQLSHEKAIGDYLRGLGSIPAEFDDRAKDTMRQCLYNAGLTDSKESDKVEFTTEPEAAAIYCMRNLKGQNEIIPIDASFMVVDCGGGTVDLTTRGFSESKYLQMRVKEEFGKLVPAIIVPKQPIAAIVRGACDYGLKMSTISDRTLKYTYGVRVGRIWKEGDPPSQKIQTIPDHTYIFSRLVIRGTRVGVDQEFSRTYSPSKADATSISFSIYKTTELSAEFCNEPGMKLHGTLRIDLPDVHLGLDRDVEFSLIFGKLELIAKAKNLQNERIYDTSFDLDF
ncbi:unnamed protein product [Rhizophagus irregularis]|nr:unnamed protein product [Rhizophagus irregularis]